MNNRVDLKPPYTVSLGQKYRVIAKIPLSKDKLTIGYYYIKVAVTGRSNNIYRLIHPENTGHGICRNRRNIINYKYQEELQLFKSCLLMG